MANTEELVEAICSIIRAGGAPVPITLMNHGVDEVAAIIGAVVERCAKFDIALAGIAMDPALGAELGLHDGRILDHGHSPVIRWESGLGRQLIFTRG